MYFVEHELQRMISELMTRAKDGQRIRVERGEFETETVVT